MNGGKVTAGDSAVPTVTMESYTFFPPPSAYALLMAANGLHKVVRIVTVFEGVGGPRLKIYSHPAGVRCNIWLLISASIEHHTGIPRSIEKLKRYVVHVFQGPSCEIESASQKIP